MTDEQELGKVDPPQTATEAAALLRRVADGRQEYLPPGFKPKCDPEDLTSAIWHEVNALRMAATLIETGDIGGLVPSWLWDEIREQMKS